jgi:hypothetical protein
MTNTNRDVDKIIDELADTNYRVHYIHIPKKRYSIPDEVHIFEYSGNHVVHYDEENHILTAICDKQIKDDGSEINWACKEGVEYDHNLWCDKCIEMIESDENKYKFEVIDGITTMWVHRTNGVTYDN